MYKNGFSGWSGTTRLENEKKKKKKLSTAFLWSSCGCIASKRPHQTGLMAAQLGATTASDVPLTQE